MHTRVFCTIIFLLFSLACATAQEKVDSLSPNNLTYTATKRGDLGFSLNLAEKLLKEGRIADALFYANEAILLSGKDNNLQSHASANEVKGRILLAQYNPSDAVPYFSEAILLFEKRGELTKSAVSNLYLGQAFIQLKEYDKARQVLNASFTFFQNKSMKVEEAQTLRLLGDVAFAQKLTGEAKGLYSQATEAWLEAGNLEMASAVSRELGNIDLSMGDWESAEVYLRQSFNLSSSTNNRPGMMQDFLALGQVLALQQEHAEAQESFLSAYELAATEQDTAIMAIAQAEMGKLWATHQPSEASRYFTKATDLLAHTQVFPSSAEIYETAAAFFQKNNQLEKAYALLQSGLKARASIFDIEKNKSALDISTRYESKMAVEKHRAEVETFKLQQKSESEVRWALITVLLFALAAIWAFYHKNRRKKLDNSRLQQMNEQVEAKNDELIRANQKLDETNALLVHEIAEREMHQQASFDKDERLLQMSREMRQPLQKIQFITRNLLASEMSDLQKEIDLKELQYRATDLFVMINDLLEENHIEAGKLGPLKVEFNPAEAAAQVHLQYSKLFGTRNVPFALEYDTKIPSRLIGAPTHVAQIAGYLLDYCIEIGIPATAGLKISLAENHSDTCLLRMDIQVRFPDNIQHPVFAASQTAVNMAKRLTEILNGHFEAAPADSDQLAWCVFLPFEKVNPDIALPDADKVSLNGRRILLVEDNKISQTVVYKLLEKYGAKVVISDNGREALSVIHAEMPFDLILMDIQMPVLDGYRATAEIRRLQNLEKARVPIIAFTASAYLTDKDKAQLFQMNDYIGKPFSPEELLAKLVARPGLAHNVAEDRPIFKRLS